MNSVFGMDQEGMSSWSNHTGVLDIGILAAKYVYTDRRTMTRWLKGIVARGERGAQRVRGGPLS